ncbi:hypothetical protein GOODEAATRI_006513, partial [Goodea atripinnis]
PALCLALILDSMIHMTPTLSLTQLKKSRDQVCSGALWLDLCPHRLCFADKRAHHNALERKRRDHIKDSFHSLRDSVPALQGEKVGKYLQGLGKEQMASRAQILDKATEYIQYMRRKNHTHQQDIDDLKRQNALLEQQGNHCRKPECVDSLVSGLNRCQD